ncbi:MAG: hypothetical protein ACYTXT_43095 [Nostoc sp.]|uniref:hypothetical protein n=1 Tax=unclassified Nostoc TaxID=2593658 RepID=UPI002AD1FAB8|nr:hypothetical protein [Nostoc sp. ChiQUE02]MDZ8233530.1 hypothetical protein [Nostoc sp. ChiQUE02]
MLPLHSPTGNRRIIKAIVVRQQGLSDVESQIWHKAIALAVYKSDRSSSSAIFQLPMPI